MQAMRIEGTIQTFKGIKYKYNYRCIFRTRRFMEEQIEKYMYYIVFLYSNSASAVTSESTVKIKKQTFPF